MTARPSILLITSNGFGMGHLVRQLAIASAMPADVRCTLMTLSQAAPVAAAAGAVLEYCPSYTSPWLHKRAWHRGYLRERIVALAMEVQPDVIAFDGVVPYPGLLDALRRLPARRVWFRRGVWRADAATAPLAYSGFFDLIIEPGDLGHPRDHGPTSHRSDATRIGVITQAGPAAMQPREDAAERLGIDPERPALLFNVGSNAIPGLANVQRDVAAGGTWQVLTTKDALGRARSGDDSIRPVTGLFPLHPWLSAIDLAVTSVGYNAAHEFIAAGVPTVLVPATNATDDQRARAEAIAAAGAGIVVAPEEPDHLAAVLANLMADPAARNHLQAGARALADAWSNGTAEAVTLLLDQAAQGPAQRRVPLAARFRLSARLLAERLLAPFVSDRVTRLVVMSTELSPEAVNDPTTVLEHLHPGTSAAYREARMRVARRWFRGGIATP